MLIYYFNRFKSLRRIEKYMVVAIIVIILAWAHSLYYNKGSYTKDYYISFNEGLPRSVGSDSKGEVECRQILEKIFNRPFSKIRPSFLKNPFTGRNLEIDCYNEELKLGLEFQGRQHYYYTPHFHRTENDFVKQVQRDQMKREMCRKNGVTLIEVPFNVENKYSFIVSKLKEAKRI